MENDFPSENIILEHHSNLDPCKDVSSEEYQHGFWKISSETWNSTIIFTTTVQFMNSLFASSTKNTRRMHNLAKSVLIFDEVQTIPIKTVYLFNEAINFLSQTCGSTVVLCTATQPLLNSSALDHPVYLGKKHEIVTDVNCLYKQLKRTEIIEENDGKKVSFDYVSALAINNIERCDSVLIIVNTKKSAKEIHKLIYDEVSESIDTFHLSTNMCPAHRADTIEVLKKNLLDKKKTICVSTQLIEAGVDIDFNVVIRSIAGLDSIAQAAGRCNRNGTLPDTGKVYLVELDEYINKLEDIRSGAEHTKRILRDAHEPNFDILDLEIMDRYHQHYFYDNKGKMSYNDGKNNNIFSLLSDNRALQQEYYAKNGSAPSTRLPQSFERANAAFKMIDDGNIAVIVQYDAEGKKLVSELCSDKPSAPHAILLKKAQKYSINIFEHTFNELLNAKALIEIENNTGASGLYYLIDGNYDSTYGLHDSRLQFIRGF